MDTKIKPVRKLKDSKMVMHLTCQNTSYWPENTFQRIYFQLNYQNGSMLWVYTSDEPDIHGIPGYAFDEYISVKNWKELMSDLEYSPVLCPFNMKIRLPCEAILFYKPVYISEDVISFVRDKMNGLFQHNWEDYSIPELYSIHIKCWEKILFPDS